MRRAVAASLALLGLVSAWSTACGAVGTSASATTASAGGSGGVGPASASGAGGDALQTIGAGGGGGSEACAKSVTEGKLRPTNLLFVIDRSGSMNCNPPPLQTSTACELNPTAKDSSKPSRWDVVASALKETFAKMPAATKVGLALFNSDDACGVSQAPSVALAPLSTAQLTLLAASVDAVKPKGATPIVGAVTLGYKHLFEDLKAEGNSFVVLLTDGDETCAVGLQQQFVSETVPLAYSVGIRTFVLGAPGSDPARALLSQIAWSGGTAVDPQCKHAPAPSNVGDCHFDMTDPSLDFAAELSAALEKVSGTALTCELDVPSVVGDEIDYDKVNVTYDPSLGEPVALFQDEKPCASADGWQYSSDKTKILLCGATCDKVKTDPTGKVTIELGCTTMVAQ
ncbi:MAG: VWA domain-containing protein [Deltaproteobacteria bacterium]|nr:VWA domain-containing protein [Deltaproteobacteria bacterium]